MARNTYIRLRLLEDEKTAPALIEHAMEHLVQDHLRQPVLAGRRDVSNGIGHVYGGGGVLKLDSLPVLTNLLRDVLNLDDRVRLYDPQEVLLQ